MQNWLDTPAAAKYLGLSVHTLIRWRWLREGPTYSRLYARGRGLVRYSIVELDRFLKAREVAPLLKAQKAKRKMLANRSVYNRLLDRHPLP